MVGTDSILKEGCLNNYINILIISYVGSIGNNYWRVNIKYNIFLEKK